MTKLQVKDVFDLQIGKTPSRKKPEYWTDGTIDWVSIRDLGTYDRYVGSTKEQITQLAVDESGIKPAPPNTLIMSFKLSLGKTAITIGPTYTNEAIMAFIDKGAYSVDLGYMFHQFTTKNWTAGTNKAVMGATLNKKSLSEAWILLPPEDEQREIALMLNGIVERLAQIRKHQMMLDQLVKSRFVEMFEPVEETSELQELIIPKTKISYGIVQPGPEGTGDMGVLRPVDIIDGRLSLSNVKRIDRSIGDSYKRTELTGDEILTVVRGATGQTVRSTSDVAGMNVTRGIAVIRYDAALVDPDYLVACMNSDSGQRYIAEHTQGATLQQINIADLKTMPIKMPPLALQQEFAAFVQQVDKLKLITQQQIEKLQMLYDSLAQEYFSI